MKKKKKEVDYNNKYNKLILTKVYVTILGQKQPDQMIITIKNESFAGQRIMSKWIYDFIKDSSYYLGWKQ